MFEWLSGRKQQERKTQAIIDGALDAVSKLGALMEDYSGSVLDVSELPLPKPVMKQAIKILLKVSADPNQREALEVAFLSLANFQDGVGKKPINLMIAPSDSPEEVVSTLGPILPWMNKTTTEMQELKRELDSFNRQQ